MTIPFFISMTDMVCDSILTNPLQGEGASWDVFFHLKQRDVGSEGCNILLGFEMSLLWKCSSYLVTSKGTSREQSGRAKTGRVEKCQGLGSLGT